MARAVFSAVAAVGLFVGPAAAADTFLKPGDTGTIKIPIENNDGSIFPLQNVRVQVTAPAYFVIDSSSTLTVPSGETQDMLVNFHIANDATDGQFEVALKIRMDSPAADPPPDSFDTSVHLTTSCRSSSTRAA